MRNESINVLLQQISLKNPGKLYSTTLSKTRDRAMGMIYNEAYAVQMYSGYIYTELLWMGHKLRIIYWGIPSVDNLRYGYTTQSGTNTYYLGIWSESSTIIENFLAVPQLSVDTDRFYISRSGDLITKDWNNIKSIDNIYHQDIPHLKLLLDNFRDDTGMYSNKKTPQRLHILLSGTPGCGKTQTAYSVAKYLKLPLYTDTNLSNLLNYVGKMNAVLLFDEMDTIVRETSRKTKINVTNITNTQSDEFQMHPQIMRMNMMQPMPSQSQIKLSDILTIMDNPFPICKQVIIICCNNTEKIDKRIFRPGRVNIHLKYEPIKGCILEKMLDDILINKISQLDKMLLINSDGVIPSLIEHYAFVDKESEQITKEILEQSESLYKEYLEHSDADSFDDKNNSLLDTQPEKAMNIGLSLKN
jgi:hypothetical protein